MGRYFYTQENETVIVRLRAEYMLLTNRCVKEGNPVPPCEPCDDDTKTGKHLITSCRELLDIRLGSREN